MIVADARRLPYRDAVADAICTDPPYGLEFMGKEWDKLDSAHAKRDRSDELGDPSKRPFLAHSVAYVGGSVAQKWHESWAREALRVAKPGAHLVAFGGTRTHHRLMCAIEDAGWEIRDCLMWVYGSGFPKSHDVSKAIDKAAGALSTQGTGFVAAGHDGRSSEMKQDKGFRSDYGYKYSPATDDAKRWEGWGTALAPSYEPIILARKPLIGTVARNVLEYGTGGLNIDGCRIEGEKPAMSRLDNDSGKIFGMGGAAHRGTTTEGRWPKNVVHDGSEEVLACFPGTKSGAMAAGTPRGNRAGYSGPMPASTGSETIGDSGSAARFFYCAKAAAWERGEGNSHPTVKPVALMRWLVRLVCPPGGKVLDPFSGSGSTGMAAMAERCVYLPAELSPEYARIQARRLREHRAVARGEALVPKRMATIEGPLFE